ncbi:coordinator of PRMT5 and differentiation stimulator isoform X3 [Symphalangus syndactylus]|uniref:coordinator of PRMT5 and differentiation stimulator isoform X3 n=1 Tax=Symphalangus syndactylus TaxID=9590 RepID=UPI0024425491|nr:coordinator of PRMT5 and differentiation stimulator isoform X2 [Symphalangus syndactylus]
MGGDAGDREPGPAARSLGEGQAGFATADHSGQERETEKAVDQLESRSVTRLEYSGMMSAHRNLRFPARGAQSIPNDSPARGEGTHSEEEGFAMDEEDSDGELNTWELSEGTNCPPKEQPGNLFNEDWDLELKADQGSPYDADDIQESISQELKPWVCCAPQGDMIYDPSWHHPPPLVPYYSKMVFETGQFDDAED